VTKDRYVADDRQERLTAMKTGDSRPISRRALIAGLGAGGMLAASSLYLGKAYGSSVSGSVYGNEGGAAA
jgi:hypothetical protein